MKIGELSTRSQVPIKTIRYYEEIGLLLMPDRTEGHFRLFPSETIQRLLFIKRLQMLSLSLQEVKDCLCSSLGKTECCCTSKNTSASSTPNGVKSNNA
jgi:DNA-binding transcriptional MerR regulator